MDTNNNNHTDIYKRAKLDDDSRFIGSSSKVIGTHSGTFQADEAMGCFLLRQLPEYRQSKIVRSRDLTLLDSTCDIVIDVGGIYDHSKLRYDHHQRDYDERFDMSGRCTKLSASGLVYRHYGKDVIQQYYPRLPPDQIEWVYIKLYDTLLEALDAIDTGVEMAPQVLYKDNTGLSSRVSRLNPRWNEEEEANSGREPPNVDELFVKAMDLCRHDFLDVLTKIVESDLPARAHVERAIENRHQVDVSGEILVFPLTGGGLPWRTHLYELEKEHNIFPLIKFVLYTDQAGMWRVQAVTVEGKAYENRLSLPEEWRGVRDADLEAVTKIPGSRFVHATGFIGGNDTYEGALAMAQEALKLQTGAEPGSVVPKTTSSTAHNDVSLAVGQDEKAQLMAGMAPLIAAMQERPLIVKAYAMDDPSAPSLLTDENIKCVHFVRHGQGFHNLMVDLAREQGRTWVNNVNSPENPYSMEEVLDAPLTNKGREQALHLQPKIAALKDAPELVVFSPNCRALQTGMIVFETLAGTIPFLAHEAVREEIVHVSDKRRAKSRLQKEFPLIDFTLLETEDDVLFNEKVPETALGLCNRIYKFLEWLEARKVKHVGVSSHSAWLLTLFNANLKTKDESLQDWFQTGEMRSVILQFVRQ